MGRVSGLNFCQRFSFKVWYTVGFIGINISETAVSVKLFKLIHR